MDDTQTTLERLQAFLEDSKKQGHNNSAEIDEKKFYDSRGKSSASHFRCILKTGEKFANTKEYIDSYGRGKTVDEAINNALDKLDTRRAQTPSA